MVATENSKETFFKLDEKQQFQFVKFYHELPEKSSSTVRFFNRTDFYTVHGEDATLISSITGVVISFIGFEPKLSCAVLNKSQFESLVRDLLLVRQYRVEVYLKGSAHKNNDWILEYKGSPGNLSQFEDLLFDHSTILYSNYVMAIKLVQKNTAAIAFVDVTELKFSICEVDDNECFTELEALLAQKTPRECVMPLGESPELKSLQKVLERNGVLVVKTKKGDFNSNDIIQDLNRLLFFHEFQTRNALTLPETNKKNALDSLTAVIKFLNLTGDEKNFNQYQFEKLDAHKYVRMDQAALYALNAFPQKGTVTNDAFASNSKSFSLFGVLDLCVTNQGKRLLNQWIKQPLKDINIINERLDIVECFVQKPEIRTTLAKDTLTRLSDMVMLVKKLTSKKASLQDCYKIYQNVVGVLSLIHVLRTTENKTVKSVLVDPLTDLYTTLEKFQSMMEEVLDMDLVQKGEFFVNPAFDDELKELSSKKKLIEEKMQKVNRKAASELGLEEAKVKLEFTDQHGYFMRITVKDEQALRNSKNYTTISVLKGGVRFTNDRLTSLNDDYSKINEEYADKQKDIVNDMFKVAVEYTETLRVLNVFIATVDVLVAFSNVAMSSRMLYVRPKLHKEGSGVLKLKKARHPCLEQQDHISFIPNSVNFDRNDKTFYIITGPNMCGKSTYIRSIGICVLMAHIGCFVPCDEAEISIVDSILSRVGADDCQLKGLSTFMLEMIEASTIVKTATENSLVIIDELGRGTSTYDGCGIAWAIAEYLASEVKCFSLFATHYHEIMQLADNYSAVANLHVTAITEEEKITPLYQIQEGACDRSYGIHCARMVGFPPDVIKWAEEYQKNLEHSEGTKFIGNLDNTKKQQILNEGDLIIQKTLMDLKTQQLDKLTDAEILQKIEEVKRKLESSDNLFIKGLLTK